MKRIEVTLPALGTYVVPFFKESEEILFILGEKEQRRLDRIHHLGITAEVFTGVNHSRLEYLLLQCAIINLLPKFHRGDENFALSSPVRIPGQSLSVQRVGWRSRYGSTRSQSRQRTHRKWIETSRGNFWPARSTLFERPSEDRPLQIDQLIGRTH